MSGFQIIQNQIKNINEKTLFKLDLFTRLYHMTFKTVS